MILFLLLFVCFHSCVLLLLLLVMAFILLILPKRQKKYSSVLWTGYMRAFGPKRERVRGYPCARRTFYMVNVYLYIYLFSHTKEVTAASDNLFIWNLLYLIWLSMVAFLREASFYGGMIEIPSPFPPPYTYTYTFSLYFIRFFLFSFSFGFFSISYFPWIVSIFTAVVAVSGAAAAVAVVPFWIILSVYCFARCFFK